MLEFIILMVIIDLLCKIKVREKVEPEQESAFNPWDNGKPEHEMLNNAWQFKSVDDCFEFRELRRSGWRGNAEDFYRWKEEE